jgi:hypothetical protein
MVHTGWEVGGLDVVAKKKFPDYIGNQIPVVH